MSVSVLDAIEMVKSRIGVEGPPVTVTVEAGHVRRFVEAIGDANPRWEREAPPTFVTALASPTMHLDELEGFGKGWLNGGSRFEYLAPILIGDRITARGHIADVYDKAGSTGDMLFIVYETVFANQQGDIVARTRGTVIRR
jgi:N-terminal half of MaoC dehydratase